MEPISLLVVDDNTTFLNIATRFLRQHKDVIVVGTAASSEAAVLAAAQLQPRAILLDLYMPPPSGLEIIPRLRQTAPEAKIIILSLFDGDGYRQAAFAAGVHDFVSKTEMYHKLLPALRRALQPAGPARIGTQPMSPS